MRNLAATVAGFLVGATATSYFVGLDTWPTFVLGGLAMLCSLAVNRCLK